ncbi:MAG: transglutaminase-like domain-containing protein [Patescibacteria group bacterium]|jgi:transglutaminase-like putative cysteine protease
MRIKSASLKKTIFCDCDNSKIIDIALKLTQGCVDEKEKAVRLFDYVKNSYKYSFGPWDLLASQTIGLGVGMCTTKANLLVALLRASGIPANFKIIRIKAREVFGKFAVFNFLKKKISEESIHIYISVYLKDGWHDIDPSLDKSLIRGLVAVGYDKSMISDWNGEGNYLNFIEPRQTISFIGEFENIDDYHKKKRKTARNLFLFMSRIIMCFYRIVGKINFIKE